MTEPTQKNRFLSVNTILGSEKLLLRSMTGKERLSSPFEYELALLSTDMTVAPDTLLGTAMTVALTLSDNSRRFYHGYVSRFSFTGFQGRYACYQAVLVPLLWFLSRSADCRIFQSKTVPNIVKEIFEKYGLTDIADRCSGSFRQWEYCVQYRETDLNFINRLLEHEGIYYFFEHVDGKHTLVFANDSSAHSTEFTIPFYRESASWLRELDHIDHWIVNKEVCSGAFVHKAFDFTVPKTSLLKTSNVPKEHALASMEVFDFPNDYTKAAEGQSYAKIRLEELQTEYETVQATGNARDLTCGALFTLTDYPRDDQNRKYLIIGASYVLQSNDFESTATVNESELFCITLTAIDAQTSYRPPRITPKPVVQGSQTAIVVGKSGEEIWTDVHGRVKVQFHWDRYGESNEMSSCWIRVAQIWAGKGWGGIMTPRIGQEVIVDFLEGDPDQPIITGRVYNGDCTPPYTLPDEATKTTIKTSSSKGGAGFNEIRLEDKKDSEQIFIHAEKDYETRVKHDAVTWIGNEQHLIVTKDQLEQIDGKQHLTIASDQLEKVGGDKHLTVTADYNQKVSSASLNATMNILQKAGMKYAADAGQEIHLKGGMNVVIEAGMMVTLKASGSFVTVGPTGVTISGPMVLINSGGAAGAGSGCSPASATAPTKPREAGEATAGGVSTVTAQTPPPAPTVESKTMVKALEAAAENGDAFL
ncbi:type VI secretion system Vgr family protein [Chromatium okenii]|uniref:Type VI secretion system tip protein VgrG n=1 Tax=Chromatium okenii TaxID=61644 RepID=A0A2S7XNZ7_9GAMM|nr:type VI secretion system tip protein VgrG [Chromatium okenii]MBV5311261.1 type VI secretion system tip protein VgrG [Chromatium okenii]PQJ95158.1 type VI secretion system tip protein VgrG [Chromatium okenii]